MKITKKKNLQQNLDQEIDAGNCLFHSYTTQMSCDHRWTHLEHPISCQQLEILSHAALGNTLSIWDRLFPLTCYARRQYLDNNQTLIKKRFCFFFSIEN
jgi:hypothetical protein